MAIIKYMKARYMISVEVIAGLLKLNQREGRD
jgi:hypothetical protein